MSAATDGSGHPRPVSHVSDTALWVAVHRATESKRKDALFHDPYAERLAGERGKEIVGQLDRLGRTGAPQRHGRTMGQREEHAHPKAAMR